MTSVPRQRLDNKVYKYVAKNPGCTSADIADTFKIVGTVASHSLKRLEQQNLVKRMGVVRAGPYRSDMRSAWEAV